MAGQSGESGKDAPGPGAGGDSRLPAAGSLSRPLSVGHKGAGSRQPEPQPAPRSLLTAHCPPLPAARFAADRSAGSSSSRLAILRVR